MPATFNARAETVSEEADVPRGVPPAACIIPASGFFEWIGEKGDKTPPSVFGCRWIALVGLRGPVGAWKNPEGDEVLSATVIVSGASEWMIPYHDRMPVLLPGADIDGWLDGTPRPGWLESPRPRVPCANGQCRSASIVLASGMMIRPSSSQRRQHRKVAIRCI